jgi:hypothetical protein
MPTFLTPTGPPRPISVANKHKRALTDRHQIRNGEATCPLFLALVATIAPAVFASRRSGDDAQPP